MRRAVAALGGLALSIALAAPLGAQRQPSPVGIARPSLAGPAVAPMLLPTARASDRPASPWPYVTAGAVVGGIVTLAAVATYAQSAGRKEECVCSPVAFAPVVVGGAALGAAGGYLLYHFTVEPRQLANVALKLTRRRY